jgi:hypothetical protein
MQKLIQDQTKYQEPGLALFHYNTEKTVVTLNNTGRPVKSGLGPDPSTSIHGTHC